jgi:UDP-2,3-diacylglucosamine hydrolase
LEKEFQFQFTNRHSNSNDVDYYIFGHRHKPIDVPIGTKSRLINLGDWVSKYTYAVWDGKMYRYILILISFLAFIQIKSQSGYHK